jgi:hypothetical protein
MRPLRKAILAGAAAIVLVGAGLAAAEIKNTHVLDVCLPDGSLAHIRYVGDRPPTVSFAPAPPALSIFSPASDPFGPASPFATLEQISQAMDRQAEAMLREVSARPGLFTGPDMMQVDVERLPPGARGFSMVSTMSGNGVCTRSVEYRSLGDGKPPQVVTRTSGACTADEKHPAPSVTSGSAAVASLPDHARRQPNDASGAPFTRAAARGPSEKGDHGRNDDATGDDRTDLWPAGRPRALQPQDRPRTWRSSCRWLSKPG